MTDPAALPAHRINIAADGEAALAMSPELEAKYKNLVSETGVLFGARHYRHYDFLLTLSDRVAHFGLEHYESSDNRLPERSLLDEDLRKPRLAGLLPHEMVHSWNGKCRRPAGLAIGRLDEPMKGGLLWVYEGLTEYLGQILTARSGLLTAEQYRQSLALTAAEMDSQKGRSWRPLADTAVAAQVLYGARSDWGSWRRGVGFYPESELLWLEADMLIRRETKGKKSLDDFCRLFYGGESGPPKVVAYTFEDVADALTGSPLMTGAAFGPSASIPPSQVPLSPESRPRSGGLPTGTLRRRCRSRWKRRGK
jgi:predicted metalloprotease with PDZ domain